MGFFRKIKWRRGMEITPATFEAVDRFNEALASTSRRMSISACHGLLPHTDINFPVTVMEDTISVQVYSLEAVARSGMLFQITGDSITLKPPYASGRECYVVVHYEGDDEQVINDVPYAKPRFAYDFCQLDEIGLDSIPIAKLFLNHDKWSVQELWIPPCMTVGAHPELFKIVRNCFFFLSSIISKLSSEYNNPHYVALKMLAVELDSYDGSESPKDFYVLLRKICLAISSVSVGNDRIPPLPEPEQFNNDDVLLAISPMVDYVETAESAVTPAPVVEQPRVHVPPTFQGEVWDAETRK